MDIQYYWTTNFRYGKMLGCKNSLVYLFDTKDLPGLKVPNQFDFPDTATREAILQVVPVDVTYEKQDGNVVSIVRKPGVDTVSLSDLEGLVNERDFDTALKWVTSRLLKFGLWCKGNGFILQPLDYRQVFVQASAHTIFLPEFFWSRENRDSNTELEYVDSIKTLGSQLMSQSIEPQVRDWLSSPTHWYPEALQECDDVINDIHDAMDENERPYVPLKIDTSFLYS